MSVDCRKRVSTGYGEESRFITRENGPVTRSRAKNRSNLRAHRSRADVLEIDIISRRPVNTRPEQVLEAQKLHAGEWLVRNDARFTLNITRQPRLPRTHEFHDAFGCI